MAELRRQDCSAPSAYWGRLPTTAACYRPPAALHEEPNYKRLLLFIMQLISLAKLFLGPPVESVRSGAHRSSRTRSIPEFFHDNGAYISL